MSDLIILALLAGGQMLAALVLLLALTLFQRLRLALRLCLDRGLSYTWSRAWRKAGYHLQH